MQQIQLFIEGTQVDMYEDESVVITQSIQNVRDIAKIFTDFSKTFTLPATKTNNQVFKHWYNNSIENGFDARKKKDAVIELNYIPYQIGNVKLEGVNMQNGKPVSYKITFYGNIITLKDLFGDDKLNALDLEANNIPYNSGNIKTSLQADPTTNDLIVPLITHTDRLFYDSTGAGHSEAEGNLFYQAGAGHKHGVLWDQLKYALRVDTILRAIETDYGLTFSNDFFNATNTDYYNLFMWLHRKKGSVESADGSASSPVIVNGFTPELDPDTQTEMFSASVLRVFGLGIYYTFYDLTLTTASADDYKVTIYRNGSLFFSSGTVSGTQTFDQVDMPTLDTGDYQVYIQSETNINFTSIDWTVTFDEPGELPFNKTYSTGSYTNSNVFEFDISQQMPDIKVIDFMTGLFKMFNLTAYSDNLTGVIVVKTLDDYYSGGVNYDITKYVFSDESTIDIALPYREISFGYDDTGSFLAALHEQFFSYTWAEEVYTAGERLDGGTYNVKLPFSIMKYERIVDVAGGNTDIQWGYSVDDNQSPYIGKPLLFYPIRQTGATPISFRDSTVAHSSLTNYNVPSNSVALSSATSTSNINFKNEINEYSGDTTFTGTLFQNYYRNYIQDVFNVKNRITKVKAYLPNNVLMNFTLADRFIIGGDIYKINSVQTNLKTGLSNLDLIYDL